jgi:catechol 2,3-dioxygenase-like lactoylglutathione lyase family enzyme
MQVKSLDHIHIYSTTPESSAGFYVQHFGAKEIVRNHNNQGDERIFLALGGQVLVVGDFPEGHTASPPPEAGDGTYRQGFGVAHFGLRVESVERGLEELIKADVRVLGGLVHEKSGLTYAYVAAPDGVVIELTQYESPS